MVRDSCEYIDTFQVFEEHPKFGMEKLEIPACEAERTYMGMKPLCKSGYKDFALQKHRTLLNNFNQEVQNEKSKIVNNDQIEVENKGW